MCHFVTATLPSLTVSRQAREVIEKHQLLFEPVQNPYVTPQLGSGVGYFRATDCYCDCGTRLGGGRSAGVAETLARRVENLRRKGWSEAKIARWVTQQEENRRDTARKESTQSPTPTLEAWLAFLAELLDSGAAESVGILLHWYSGSVEDEQVQITRVERVLRPALSEECLLKMKENVLYRFVGSCNQRTPV